VSQLVARLAQKLFLEQPEQASAFAACLLRAPEYADCIVTLTDESLPFRTLPPRPEQPSFVLRLEPGQQPGKSELHAAGKFYCMDYSSVIAILPCIEAATKLGQVETVVDVCASPGGKSIFAWRAVHPEQLISNEMAGSRVTTLKANLNRCGITTARISHKTVENLVEIVGPTADLVLVDAPCSGQSLLAKGEKSSGAFHPAIVNGNSNRQKRIVANSLGLLKPGGFLVYSTCTYAIEENENVVKWILKKFPSCNAIEVGSLAEFRSQISKFPSYRLFPQSGLGAGSFSALIQKLD
jgi:16S rRNA C967 or C1407 C5-methylase (RsmB/RsmF family)